MNGNINEHHRNKFYLQRIIDFWMKVRIENGYQKLYEITLHKVSAGNE